MLAAISTRDDAEAKRPTLKELDLDIGDLKVNEITGAIIPMLQKNDSLTALRMMNTKLPIETTC